jgi:uncharacterized protein (DUF1697 family)
MDQYVALLRGINVGGKNLIKMSDLKVCFEEQAFEEVATYIQSGNVLFSAAKAGSAASSQALTSRIEAALTARFGLAASVVVRSRKQLQQVVARAPAGFGARPDKYRYDVIFLKASLSSAIAMKSVITNPAVDSAHPGAGVLYFSRLISKATQSRLSRLMGSPIYPSVTIRNWNTTSKLLQLMDARAD